MKIDNMTDFMLGYNFKENIHVDYIPKTKPLGTTSAYLSIKELSEISADINDAATLLMTFYFRKVTHPKYDFFNDKNVAEALGWTVSKTKKTRLSLMSHGWIKKVVYTQPTTKDKHINYFLGKEICSKIKTPEEFTAEVKRREAVRKPIIEHFGLTTWEEVTNKHTEDEIIKVSQLIREGK